MSTPKSWPKTNPTTVNVTQSDTVYVMLNAEFVVSSATVQHPTRCPQNAHFILKRLRQKSTDFK